MNPKDRELWELGHDGTGANGPPPCCSDVLHGHPWLLAACHFLCPLSQLPPFPWEMRVRSRAMGCRKGKDEVG